MMLHTRIPIDRLVDWIDQSVLLLHLPDESDDDDKKKKDEKADPTAPENKGSAVPKDARGVIARLGIRKATELLSVYDSSKLQFRVAALQPKAGASDDAIDVLVTVAEAVRREPVLYHIVQWKNFPHDYLDDVERGAPSKVGRMEPPSSHAVRRSLGVAALEDVLSP